MFGDVGAWLFQYPGGFRHSWEHPGFQKLRICPQVIPEIESFRACYRGFQSSWMQKKNETHYKITVPENSVAVLILPGHREENLQSGIYEFEIMQHENGL